jgi:hypothetical protein
MESTAQRANLVTFGAKLRGAQARQRRYSRRYATWVLLGAAFVLTSCSTPPRGEVAPPPPAADGQSVVIYVVRRSWHIDIGFEATELSPPLATLRQALPQSRYLLFGFGDKHYLLSQGGTVNRLLGAILPGDAVVLLTGLTATPEESFGSDSVVRLAVSPAQAGKLQTFVWKTLTTEHGVATMLAPGPYSGSFYYASVERYSGLHTCNTWAAEALHSAGLPVHSFGVEFAGQLWSQVRRINYRGEGRRPAPSAGHGRVACDARVATDGHPGLSRSTERAAKWPAG